MPLAGGELVRFQVTFAPSARATRSATLRISTDLSATPELTVTLSGRGVAPVLAVTPASLDFGTTLVGASVQRSLTITNGGEAPLTISEVALRPTETAFALEDTNVPTLDPGVSADVAVLFAPSQSGAASAEVQIQSNDPALPTQTVPVTGTGATIEDQTPQETPRGAAVSIQIDVPDSFSPESATAFYRRAGERSYQSVPMTGTAGKAAALFSAQIPDAFVTERGVQYYVSVAGASGTVTVPMANPASQPRQIRVRVDQMTAPVTLAAEQYAQFTIPLVMEDPTVSGIFVDDLGTYDPDVWRLLRWNAADDAYREVPNLGETYQVGKGFWLITADEQSFDVENGRSVDASAPVEITLPPGSSQIGTPFAFPVAWSDVEVEEDAVSTPVAYDGTEYVYDQLVLEPWTGYFVSNDTNEPVTLRIPPLEATSAARRQAAQPFAHRLAEEGDYVVRLYATLPSQDARDTHNYLVLKAPSASKTGALHERWREAPPIDRRFSVSIVEEERRYAALAKTVRDDGGQAWDLLVRAEMPPAARHQRWPVTLSTRTSGERPPGYQLVILDRDDGRVLERKDGGWTIMLDATRPERRLRVLMGTDTFVETQAPTFEQATLAPGYPNPFTSTTRLTYRLAASQPVRIQVFDLLGRHVRTLYRGRQEAGQHAVTWDGRDDAGRRVASGTYLCRMQAGARTSVQSLIMLH